MSKKTEPSQKDRNKHDKPTGGIDGEAVVYCEGAFETTNGKTAHGLVRFTKRYRVRAVIDSRCAGLDAGEILEGKARQIPVVGSLEEALVRLEEKDAPKYLVIGLAPEGGRLSLAARKTVKSALKHGLNIDSGLHDFLSDDPEMVSLAQENDVAIRDVRKPPSRDKLHFFSGKIEEVESFKAVILGTDSAVGKRTTSWLLVQGLVERGYTAEMIGTGQTSWLQGANYGVRLDSLVNDFVAGEIEHAVWSAWKQKRPDVMIVEGQGSLMNPAYPGGFEIIAAARPDVIILQHAPKRQDYDGFPGYPIHSLARQIQALAMISEKPVAAVAINHEGIEKNLVPVVCEATEKIIGLPVVDVLMDGKYKLVSVLEKFLKT